MDKDEFRLPNISDAIEKLPGTMHAVNRGTFHHAELGPVPAFHAYDDFVEIDIVYAYTGDKDGVPVLEAHVLDDNFVIDGDEREIFKESPPVPLPPRREPRHASCAWNRYGAPRASCIDVAEPF